jgi:hypothetical protein
MSRSLTVGGINLLRYTGVPVQLLRRKPLAFNLLGSGLAPFFFLVGGVEAPPLISCLLGRRLRTLEARVGLLERSVEALRFGIVRTIEPANFAPSTARSKGPGPRSHLEEDGDAHRFVSPSSKVGSVADLGSKSTGPTRVQPLHLLPDDFGLLLPEIVRGIGQDIQHLAPGLEII